MREVKREGKDPATKVFVEPVVSGFPPGAVLAFAVRPAGGKQQTIATGYVTDSAGAIVCGDRAAHADLAAGLGGAWCPTAWANLGIVVGSTRPAEPMHFMAYTIDAAHPGHRAYATVIARPLRAVQDGCTLEAELVMPPHGYVMEGWGFQPSDSVRYESRSGKGVAGGVFVADSVGWLPPAYVVPGIQGKKGGQATHEVVSSTCRVTLKYPWGDASR